MELTNDELKDLIQELHNRIEFLENKTLNSDDRNNKPDNYIAIAQIASSLFDTKNVNLVLV